MAEEEEEQEQELAKPSKLPLILGVVGAAVLGIGGGFAASTLLSSPEDQEAADAAALEEVMANRTVYEVGRFRVNLRGSGGERVLHIELSVEMEREAVNQDSDEKEPEVLELRTKSQIRDAVITLASDYTYSDMEGLDGKTRLRDELLARLKALLPEKKIERIYFTEFMVQ